MINQYPAWKYALIAVVLAAGALFALPNLFGEDPAVQVSAARGAPIDEALRDRLTDRIETRGIADHGFIRSIYFRDPNGYVVELSARKANAESSGGAAARTRAARDALDEWQGSKKTPGPGAARPAESAQ